MEASTNGYDTNTSISGLEQEAVLIFALAWKPGGAILPRIFSVIIAVSIVMRILGNVVTVAALMTSSTLRWSKEHLLITYMALFDFADGCWYFCMANLDYGIQTRLSCFLTVRHLLWFLLGGQGSTLMLTMISLDRLICIFMPLWYWDQGPWLSHALAAITALWSLGFGGYLAHIPITWPDELVPYCFTSHTFLHGFDIDGIFRRFWLISSVVLYLVVAVFFKRGMTRHLNQVAPYQSERQLEEAWSKHRKLQKKITASLGISAIITTVFNVLPLTFWHWLRDAHPHLQQLGYVSFALINWSSAVNLILFCTRHEEVKHAVTSLITCRYFNKRKAMETGRRWTQKLRLPTSTVQKPEIHLSVREPYV